MKATAGIVILFIKSFITSAFVVQPSSSTKSPSFFTSKGRHYQQKNIKMADQQPTTANGGENSVDKSSAAKAIDFLTLTRSLKTTKRTGWVLRKVSSNFSLVQFYIDLFLIHTLQCVRWMNRRVSLITCTVCL